MLTIGKALVGLSALISAGLVAAQRPADEAQTAPAAVAAKADREAATGGESCEGQAWPRITGPCLIAAHVEENCAEAAWPYVNPNCLADVRDLGRRPVRSVTVERRIDARTSELVRIPVQEFAAR